MPRDDHTQAGRGRLRGAAMGALLLGVAASSGCAASLAERTARPRETLVLESMVVHAPADPGWKVIRTFDAGSRAFLLRHGTGEEWDRAVTILEVDAAESADVLSDYREYELASQAAIAKSLLADPAAAVSEVPLQLDARFGANAVQVGIRAEESDAKAGLLVKRRVESASLLFVSPAGQERSCLVRYEHRSLDGSEPPPLEASWRALLEGIELRPADEAHVREAAGARHFPKQLAYGLARRSLTLPRTDVALGYGRERWVEPRVPDRRDGGGVDLRYGVTDRVEIGLPGYVTYSFGEPEALTRPEWAVGAGLAGLEIGSFTEDVWYFAATIEARKRLSADVALRGIALLSAAHESTTGWSDVGGGATASVVWDVHRYVTLGLETGWSRTSLTAEGEQLFWVGGRTTPVVTFHAPPFDLGLLGAAAWNEDRLHAIAGFTVGLIL